MADVRIYSENIGGTERNLQVWRAVVMEGDRVVASGRDGIRFIAEREATLKAQELGYNIHEEVNSMKFNPTDEFRENGII